MEQSLLLMILAGTAQALSVAPEHVTTCDARQFIFSCNTVSGATLYLRLMTNAAGYVLVFSKFLPGERSKVFVVKNGTVKIRESYRNRVEFSIDTGTLKITDVQVDDAGPYIFNVYTPNGTIVKMNRFFLDVTEATFKTRSVSISIFPVAGVLILILVGYVVWKTKLCRTTGYQTLH